MIWAVVMAGGVGTRFWPLSRRTRPKQLLPIFGKRTLIEETVRRLKSFIPPQRILVATNAIQRPAIRKLLKALPAGNIIIEPCSRNTASCLGLAALHIERKDPDAVFIALPADHLIRNARAFLSDLKIACGLAAEEKHVVFGIPPSHPHTGFGYIACKEKMGETGGVALYRGWKFIEKPPLWQAKAFVRSGRYFWNSGMFVWKLSFFFQSIAETLPSLSRGLARIRSFLAGKPARGRLERIFAGFPNVSIDYGLMEKVKDLYVLKARFDWNDAGSWQELETVGKKDSFGNVLAGSSVAVNSRGNIVRADRRLVALLGVRNLVVIDAGDALLVAGKDSAQEVKKLVDELRRRKLDRYL